MSNTCQLVTKWFTSIAIASALSGCAGSAGSSSVQASAQSTSPSYDDDITPVNTQPSTVTSGSGEQVYHVDMTKYAVKQPATVDLQGSLAYPERGTLGIKAIHPDSWNNKQDFVDANTGGISINLIWDNWQATEKFDSCTEGSEILFEGRCFTLNRGVENNIREWTSKGIAVTAIIWGVPEWANIGNACQAEATIGRQFCANKDPQNFARFTGLLASRFNGKNGVGRIADFVIHNEVNQSDWYNIGCGLGIACDVEQWVSSYTADFNAAYDAIKKYQPSAKVFIPFAHQFTNKLDKPAAHRPVISVQTFLTRFNTKTQGRQWRVAFHPYPKNLLKSAFGAEDLPYVTYGNIGVLAGWLRSAFPQQPEAWEIHLTESGVNSILSHSSEQEQAKGVCDSFKNILGTPGIENYVYHRMQDHQIEVDDGAGFGLHHADGTPKQAWNVWANANHDNEQLRDCGFENGAYTQLTQYTHKNRRPWSSSRIPPVGYEASESWRLLRDHKPGTVMVYECGNGNGSYTTLDATCAGAVTLGPVGYAFAEPQQHALPLFSCQIGDNAFNTNDESCGAAEIREFLGYVYR